MEILVYLDNEDKKAIEKLVGECKIGNAECEKAKVEFWYGMLDKYPVLKNRRLALNAYDHFIFSPASDKEAAKYSNLGQYYV